MVRGTWRVTVHRVTKSPARLKWLNTHEVLYRYTWFTNPPHSVPSKGPPAPVLVEPIVWDRVQFRSKGKFRFSLREWKYWSFRSRAHALPDRLWAELLCRIWAEGREGSSHETRPAPAGSLRQAQRLHVARHRHLESRSHAQLRCWPQRFIVGILAWSARFHPSVRSIVWASETTPSTKWKKIEVRVYFTT